MSVDANEKQTSAFIPKDEIKRHEKRESRGVEKGEQKRYSRNCLKIYMSQEMLEVNHKFTLMNAAREKVALLMLGIV